MRIVVYTEGRDDAEAMDALLWQVKEDLRNRGIGLQLKPGGGKQRVLDDIGNLVESEIEHRGTAAVFALLDKYPGDTTPDHLKERLRRNVPAPYQDRFHAHVFVHEFEALLLAAWDELCDVIGDPHSKSKTPHPKPEEVDDEKPPKQWVRDYFRTRGRKVSYRSSVHAKDVMNKADPRAIAAKCPHFKAFLDDLLHTAEVLY
jgi:hypothetical protein